jgi:hypothetical protein
LSPVLFDGIEGRRMLPANATFLLRNHEAELDANRRTAVRAEVAEHSCFRRSRSLR